MMAQLIAIDVLVPLPATEAGNKYTLIIADYLLNALGWGVSPI